MARPDRARVSDVAVGGELSREYAANAVPLLLRVASRDVDDWADLVQGWSQAFGEPITRGALEEMRGLIRADLAALVKHGAPAFERGPAAVSLTWWHVVKRTPAESPLSAFALEGRSGVVIEVASRNLDEYLDWAMLLLLLRDVDRLRQCQACSGFFLVSRNRNDGVYCKDAKCIRSRKAKQARASRLKWQKEHPPLREMLRKKRSR